MQTMMLRVLTIIQTSRWDIKNVQQKTNGFNYIKLITLI